MHVTEIDCSKAYDFSQKPTHFGAIYQSSFEIVLEQSTSLYCIEFFRRKKRDFTGISPGFRIPEGNPGPVPDPGKIEKVNPGPGQIPIANPGTRIPF